MKIIELSLRSHKRCEMIDITQELKTTLLEHPMDEGVITLFTPHTTAAISINENADPDVVSDMLFGLAKLIPDDPQYKHAEGNSAAHLKSSLIGVSETLIVEAGQLLLGTWQGVYFCEFDGPRNRRLTIRLSDR